MTAFTTQPRFVLKRKAARPWPTTDDHLTAPQQHIVASIRRWVELHGAPPTTADWEPSRARRAGEEWRVDRFAEGDWPTLHAVRQHFGRFNAAIEAAGCTPNRSPRHIRAQLDGPEEILGAIREWVCRYGDVPAQADWDPSRARALRQEWRIERYQSDDWPSLRSTVLHFGSLGAAIRAAGLLPREPYETPPRRESRRAANREALAAHASSRHGAAGPGSLALAVRSVTAARDAVDPEHLHAALLDVAAVALRWAGAIGSS